MPFTYEDIAQLIDHSLLAPSLTEAELDDGCAIARRYAVASVCTMPYHLRRCAELLAGSRVVPSTTIGFPHGGHTTRVKVAEAEQALTEGARELDMVVNISKVLSGDWDYVRAEVGAILAAARAHGGKLKVIFETCYLRDSHKIRLCEISGELGVDWVKTSTGFGASGATDADLRLMRAHAPAHVQVKASGGVRDLDRVLAVRALGVTRVGASRTVDLLEDLRRRLALPPLGDGAG